MTEEITYYTGNCITDAHTDTSLSYCNEEKCKQYIKSDGLKFCMSSVCSEKDCIYALVNKLHQKIDRLEQENKELRQQYNCYACDTCQGKEDYRNMKRYCENAIKTVHAYRSALEEINRTLLGVRGLSIHCDKQIIKVKAIINEVLK